VHVPKSVLLGLTLMAAAFVGWMISSSIGDMGRSQASADRAAGQTASATTPGTGHSARAKQPIHVTVVIDDSGVRAVSGEAPASASSSARQVGVVAPTSMDRRITDVAPTSTARRIGELVPTPMGEWATSKAADTNNGWVNAQVQGPAIIANGNHIVIATSGAIVSVGDNTVLKGNTGDAAASGVIAIDVANSALTSGNSSVATPLPAGSAGTDSMTTDPSDAMTGGISPMVTVGSVTGGFAAPGSRAIGIAGWQMHSIDISGNDNFATYNDSDLFFQRNGMLNGNTGDTATSGLHVVDSIGSRVRSGSSLNARQTPARPPFNPASLGSPPLSGVLTAPTAGGSVTVADINGLATASAQDSLVIGGAGVSDSSVRMRGDRNVVTYDDGNAAIGGTGDVNAQVGNSDTGGAAIMHVRSSDIAAGNSLLTAPGALSGDLLDVSHPDFGAPTTPAVP
jgi:hypothetical protein